MGKRQEIKDNVEGYWKRVKKKPRPRDKDKEKKQSKMGKGRDTMGKLKWRILKHKQGKKTREINGDTWVYKITIDSWV